MADSAPSKPASTCCKWKDKNGDCAFPWWIYPTIVFCVVTGVYSIFMGICILPQIQRLNQKPGESLKDPHAVDGSMEEVMGVCVGFHVLFMMLLICYFRAMFQDPGSIPQHSYWKEGDCFVILEKHNKLVKDLISHITMPINEEARQVIRNIPVVERKQKSGLFRYCKDCKMWKPDRSHHCSTCNRCILRMDHHCPWIANCVGFGNYKTFLLLLFYVDCTVLFTLGAMFERMINTFKPVLDWNYYFREDFIVLLSFIFLLVLFVAVTAFFIFHLGLIRTAVSTIEYREKQNHPKDKDGSIKRRWQIANIKFNLNRFYFNLRHVLGSPLLWLIPVEGRPTDNDGFLLCDGTYVHGPWQEYDGLEAHAAAVASENDENMNDHHHNNIVTSSSSPRSGANEGDLASSIDVNDG